MIHDQKLCKAWADVARQVREAGFNLSDREKREDAKEHGKDWEEEDADYDSDAAHSSPVTIDS